MEFKTRILNTVKERELFTDGDHLVLGLSGGPDSLSLYNALLELMEEKSITVDGNTYKLPVTGSASSLE